MTQATKAIPALVRWACYIWIMFGLVEGWATVSLLMGRTPAYAIFPAIFGAGFLGVGIQTLLGRAKDSIRNGIGSLGMGVIFAGFVLAFIGRELSPMQLAVSLGPAGLLVLAGSLAIAGNRRYLASR